MNKHIGLYKSSGGSVYGILSITLEAESEAKGGGTASGGSLIWKQTEETRSDFKARALKTLGVPLDSPIWGKTNPPLV